jgi:hypothetical protein
MATKPSELGGGTTMRITAAVVHEQEQPFSVEEFELEEP